MTTDSVAAPGLVRRRTFRRYFALRLALGVLCVALAGSVVWSAAHWSERRGVFDDIGYLRQAHLFRRFGIAGLNTDLNLDDDHFFRDAAADIRPLAWSDPNAPTFTHTFIPKTGKWVLQYPPGTGALLALFPPGHQAAGLYTSATILVLIGVLILIFRVTSLRLLVLSGLFGCAAIYFMINPAKASYSVGPSLALCAVLGLLTPRLFSKTDGQRLAVAGCVGLLLGLSVNLRIANVLLAGGYGFGCLLVLLRSRFASFKAETVILVAAIIVGAGPTLAANFINAGSPFATTYGSADVRPPDFTFSAAMEYCRDIQGILFVLSITCAWLLYKRSNFVSARTAALSAIANSVVNALFFFTHTLYTPYYLMPGVMLSLWIVLTSAVESERQLGLQR